MKDQLATENFNLSAINAIAELGECVGSQRVESDFSILGLDELPVYPVTHLPRVEYRKSRGRNGSYVCFTIQVYHLNDGTFLFYHPYCKLKETSSVTTVGESSSGMGIPSNVKKVTVIDVKRTYRKGAKYSAFEFRVTNYVQLHDV